MANASLWMRWWFYNLCWEWRWREFLVCSFVKPHHKVWLLVNWLVLLNQNETIFPWLSTCGWCQIVSRAAAARIQCAVKGAKANLSKTIFHNFLNNLESFIDESMSQLEWFSKLMVLTHLDEMFNIKLMNISRNGIHTVPHETVPLTM